MDNIISYQQPQRSNSVHISVKTNTKFIAKNTDVSTITTMWQYRTQMPNIYCGHYVSLVSKHVQIALLKTTEKLLHLVYHNTFGFYPINRCKTVV